LESESDILPPTPQPWWIFARMSPNLPEKNLGHLLCEFFLIEDRFCDDLQRSLCDLGLWHRAGAVFSNQSRLGAIFASIFREFAFIYKDFVKVFTDFPQISIDIVPILRDLAQIFTRSKLLGVRLHPCISVCYITDSLTFVPTVLNLFFVCLHARKSLKSQ